MFILAHKRKNDGKITIKQVFFTCFFKTKLTCWQMCVILFRIISNVNQISDSKKKKN